MAQVKISQKTAQKAAIKRLINRSVIMTVIELLLIILILSSCQKEEIKPNNVMKTIYLRGSGSVGVGDNENLFDVDFIINKGKGVYIKSVQMSSVFSSHPSLTPTLGFISGVLFLPQNFDVPEDINISTGESSSSIGLVNGQEISVNTYVKPNTSITFTATFHLDTAPLINPTPFESTLIVNFEEVD